MRVITKVKAAVRRARARGVDTNADAYQEGAHVLYAGKPCIVIHMYADTVDLKTQEGYKLLGVKMSKLKPDYGKAKDTLTPIRDAYVMTTPHTYVPGGVDGACKACGQKYDAALHSKPANARNFDTLTPIPVSGDREKDLAIAKHNAGVTRSQDVEELGPHNIFADERVKLTKGANAGKVYLFKRFTDDGKVMMEKPGGGVVIAPKSIVARARDTSPVFNLSPVPLPEDEHGRGRYAQAWGEDGAYTHEDLWKAEEKMERIRRSSIGNGDTQDRARIKRELDAAYDEVQRIKHALRSGATDELRPIPMEDAEVTTRRQPNPNPAPRQLTSLALPTPEAVAGAYQPRSATELKKSFGKDGLSAGAKIEYQMPGTSKWARGVVVSEVPRAQANGISGVLLVRKADTHQEIRVHSDRVRAADALRPITARDTFNESDHPRGQGGQFGSGSGGAQAAAPSAGGHAAGAKVKYKDPRTGKSVAGTVVGPAPVKNGIKGVLLVKGPDGKEERVHPDRIKATDADDGQLAKNLALNVSELTKLIAKVRASLDNNDWGSYHIPNVQANLKKLEAEKAAVEARLKSMGRAKDAGLRTQKCVNCGMSIYKDTKYDIGKWLHGGTSQAGCSGGPGSSQFPELWPKKATPKATAKDAYKGAWKLEGATWVYNVPGLKLYGAVAENYHRPGAWGASIAWGGRGSSPSQTPTTFTDSEATAKKWVERQMDVLQQFELNARSKAKDALRGLTPIGDAAGGAWKQTGKSSLGDEWTYTSNVTGFSGGHFEGRVEEARKSGYFVASLGFNSARRKFSSLDEAKAYVKRSVDAQADERSKATDALRGLTPIGRVRDTSSAWFKPGDTVYIVGTPLAGHEGKVVSVEKPIGGDNMYRVSVDGHIGGFPERSLEEKSAARRAKDSDYYLVPDDCIANIQYHERQIKAMEAQRRTRGDEETDADIRFHKEQLAEEQRNLSRVKRGEKVRTKDAAGRWFEEGGDSHYETPAGRVGGKVEYAPGGRFYAWTSGGLRKDCTTYAEAKAWVEHKCGDGRRVVDVLTPIGRAKDAGGRVFGPSSPRQKLSPAEKSEMDALAKQLWPSGGGRQTAPDKTEWDRLHAQWNKLAVKEHMPATDALRGLTPIGV